VIAARRVGRARHRAARDGKIIRPTANYIGPDQPTVRCRSREPSLKSHAPRRSESRAASRKPDPGTAGIADYVLVYEIQSQDAYDTAYYCLMDTLACGFLALQYPACTKLLGPVVPGRDDGAWRARAGHELRTRSGHAALQHRRDDSLARFQRHLARRRMGPSVGQPGRHSELGDYLSRKAHNEGRTPLVVRDLLTAMIKAHEIQGVLALENSFNRVGLDHVILVRVASTAVVTRMLGGNRDQIINAVSNAWIDGGALRTYRHAPNTGSRKSWAAGDATSRAVRHALIALTTARWVIRRRCRRRLGLLRRAVQGQAVRLAAAASAATSWRTCCSRSASRRSSTRRRRSSAADAAPAGQGQDRAHRAHHDRDAGARSAHHRQDRTARESRGPRSLHPVHGGDSAAVRPADADDYEDAVAQIRASMRCAPRCRSAKTRRSRRITTIPPSATSATRCRCFSRTARRAGALQVDFPDRTPQAARRGHSVLIAKFAASVAGHFAPRQAA
jgi:2-methylcitrate dehydratase